MTSRKRFARLGNWGPVRGRAAVKAAAISEPAKRPPAKKDTKHWCRGKEGVQHVPQIVLSHDGFRSRACEWVSKFDYRAIRRGEDDYRIAWACGHQELCSRCGKILRERWELRQEECPAYPGSPEQRSEAEREAAAYPDLFRAREARYGRKRAITGPQGYRRKREKAS